MRYRWRRCASTLACCLLAPAAVHAQRLTEITSCGERTVIDAARDTAWVRVIRARVPAVVMHLLPIEPGPGASRELLAGDVAAAMRAHAALADSAFESTRVHPGARSAFRSNLDSAVHELSALPRRDVALNRFAMQAGPAGPGSIVRTTWLFGAPGAGGIRVDPVVMDTAAFLAACWSAIDASIILDQLRGDRLESTRQRLQSIDRHWRDFGNTRPDQTPLEWIINRGRWKQRTELEPPTHQWIIAHPRAMLRMSGLGDGQARHAGFALDVIGYQCWPEKWRWRDFGSVSVVTFAGSAGPVWYGLDFGLSKYANLGAVTTRVAGKQAWSVVSSVDLARLSTGTRNEINDLTRQLQNARPATLLRSLWREYQPNP
jgi:hypothetical protein